MQTKLIAEFNAKTSRNGKVRVTLEAEGDAGALLDRHFTSDRTGVWYQLEPHKDESTDVYKVEPPYETRGPDSHGE